MCVIETSPVVETRRLLLRSPGPQDIPAIARLANDPDIARMTCRMPHPFGQGDAEDFVVQVAAQDPARAATFLIEHEDQGPVGVLGMFEDAANPLGEGAPETGYWIGRQFWGRGFATEALEGALVWAGKRWKRRALLAGHFADNPASGRVLEKAGFLYTGETRKRFSRARSTPVDTRMMVWLA
ncbi:GNAT family N-acetyltransferase [Brevundimonas sp.]|jgi:RimJ/RimL family protein N-acetyltransferase|uniref:GNAT family N-acetyltransferase n=1 Tax=Brevundimonas sp. TaxID=1871086 RepID=UPI00391C3446|nr:GNAT family N-acetyltransferase [Brevundimonas sp.]MCA3717105.1 GNAT family N-acetyltransferase [Brevundimonas sp.]